MIKDSNDRYGLIYTRKKVLQIIVSSRLWRLNWNLVVWNSYAYQVLFLFKLICKVLIQNNKIQYYKKKSDKRIRYKKKLYRLDNELDNGSYDTPNKKKTNGMKINVTREQAIRVFFYEEFNKSDKPDCEKNWWIEGHGTLPWKRPVAAYFYFSHINECLYFRYHKNGIFICRDAFGNCEYYHNKMITWIVITQ